jgi:GT2 family glycosyltransferase
MVTPITPAPLVGVCIANYNGLEVLPDCLDSIFRQDCDFRVEIIVHDDASTDSSLNLLKERYSEVTVIPSTINVGFCISNNRMVERAEGKYVVLLNNDAWLEPDALRVLAEHATSQQKQGILGLEQFDARNGKFVDKGSRLDPFFNATPNMDRSRTQVAQVIGACMWIPRDLCWSKVDSPD